jgi:hypothetical protein
VKHPDQSGKNLTLSHPVSHQAPGDTKGQAMAEYAMALPILTLLLFGMTLAAFYAFRAAAADWGVFISGVAGGAFDTPATDQVRQSIVWADIRNSITAEGELVNRQVRSQIAVVSARPWAFGINLVEVHEGSAYFRLWRFYPGPPPPGGIE